METLYPRMIKPDVSAAGELKSLGGSDMKKCYQCATCVTVCEVTPADNPFPRKEMLWAQWGLRDRLVADPDIWICHQCGDCNEYCPRGAKPSDLIAAARNESFRLLAWPGFMGTLIGNKLFLPLLFALPIAIFTGIAFAMHEGGQFLPPVSPRIIFREFIPVIAIQGVFIPVMVFTAIAFFMGIRKMIAGFVAVEELNPNHKPQGPSAVESVIDVAMSILGQKTLGKCVKNRYRKSGHGLTFFGFLGLVATTASVGVLMDIFGVLTPLPLNHPVKYLGNISAVMAFAGLTWLTIKRAAMEPKEGNTSYYDWFFILVLYATVTTGILSELMRLNRMDPGAYYIYFSHLVLVFVLLAYAPYSKFAHMVYRAVALVYSRMNGRI